MAYVAMLNLRDLLAYVHSIHQQQRILRQLQGQDIRQILRAAHRGKEVQEHNQCNRAPVHGPMDKDWRRREHRSVHRQADREAPQNGRKGDQDRRGPRK